MENLINQSTIVRNLRILYPIWVIVGMFGIMYVPSVLIEFTDPERTVQNLTENDLLFRLGIAGRLISQLLFIIIPFLLYLLFKNIDKITSVLMLILALISIPAGMFSELINMNVMEHLDDSKTVIELLELYNTGMQISMIFWGLWLFPLGWLVYKFGLFPKVTGICLFIAGFGYFLHSFLRIILPDFDELNMFFEILTFGELIFVLWFVAMGIKKAK